MKTATLEKLIWTLIYAGLIGVVTGLAAGRSDPVVGWPLASGGALVSLIGAVLIYVRSRMADDAVGNPKEVQ